MPFSYYKHFQMQFSCSCAVVDKISTDMAYCVVPLHQLSLLSSYEPLLYYVSINTDSTVTICATFTLPTACAVQVAQLSLTDRATHCIMTNQKILKQSRDHNHVPFVGHMSSCC